MRFPMMLSAPRPSLSGKPSRLCLALLVGLTLVALGQRLGSSNFMLPHDRDPDSHLVTSQLAVFRDAPFFIQGDLFNRKGLFLSSIYPHLLGRVAHLVDQVVPHKLPDPNAALDVHLKSPAHDERLLRRVVAILSAAVVPGTFAMALHFVPPWWALFAAGLSTFSLLGLVLGSMARPHAPAAALVSLTLAAALYLRRENSTRAFALAGLACALAVGSLHNALAVVLAVLAAVLLRDAPARRFTDMRVLLPVGFFGLSLVAFWPFLILGSEMVDPHAVKPAAGALRIGHEQVLLSEFDGSGVRAVLATLRSFEPITALLAFAAAAVWTWRLVRRKHLKTEVKSAAVLASYALPYGAVIMAFNQTSQRFVLPLVPVLCCLAAWGLRELSLGRRIYRNATLALATCALVVPAVAGCRWAWLRSQPDSLTKVAQWFQANTERARTRIGLHCTFDLPLARTESGLFLADGQRRYDIYSHWGKYQQQLFRAVPKWPGERWSLFAVHGPKELKTLSSDAEREAYYDSWALEYIVMPTAGGAALHPALQGAHSFVASRADLVQRFPQRIDGAELLGSSGEDSSNFLRFALTTDCLGPAVELYRFRQHSGPTSFQGLEAKRPDK